MIDLTLVAAVAIAAAGGYGFRALTHRQVREAGLAEVCGPPATVSKHAVMVEEDELSEPFEISLQAYGDHDGGVPAQYMIAAAMNGWQRSGCPDRYTHGNGLHVHLIVRGWSVTGRAAVTVTGCDGGRDG